MASRQPGQKLDQLTGLRAFAAIWVMLAHFSDSTGVRPFIHAGPLISRGAFGVDVFFVLSGLVLTLSYRTSLTQDRPFGARFRDYLARRFARIYPLHLLTFLLVALLVGIAVKTHYPFKAGVSYSPLAAVLNLLLMQAWALIPRTSWNTVSWSLSAEWFAYVLVFPLCVYVLERLSAQRVALLVTGTWLLFAGTTIFIEHRALTNVNHDGIFRILPEFLAGYLLGRLAPHLPRLPLPDLPLRHILQISPRSKPPLQLRVPWASLLIGLGCLAFWPITTRSGAYELLVLPATLAILLGLLRGGRGVELLFAHPISVFLGEVSFALYLVHPFIATAGNQLLRRHPAWLTRAHAPIVLTLEVAATLLASIAVYHLIEMPSRRATLALLRRWITRADHLAVFRPPL